MSVVLVMVEDDEAGGNLIFSAERTSTELAVNLEHYSEVIFRIHVFASEELFRKTYPEAPDWGSGSIENYISWFTPKLRTRYRL